MEKTIKEKSMFGITNAIFQTGALLSYSYLTIVWPMYFVMGMVGLLGLMQTIAAAGLLSGLSDMKDTTIHKAEPYHFLVGIAYFMSAYQIYLMGFVLFSGFAAAHACIYVFMIFFKWIKK